MLAGQTMVASDGYEVALFPMPYLRMSQDEGGDYSHVGTYNIDLLGWDSNGRVYQAPIYAPCTMKVVEYWSSYAWGHQVAFESVNKVHLENYLFCTRKQSTNYNSWFNSTARTNM